MSAYHFTLAFFVLMILFGMINMAINYTTRRDGEGPVPLRLKWWLIPALSAFIIVPTVLFSIGFKLIFHAPGNIGQMITYGNLGGLIHLTLLVLLGFILFESFVHPVSIASLRLLMRRDVPVYVKQSVTLFMDTIILYVISLIPGVHIHGLLEALCIAIFYLMIEWILIGVQTWIQHRKHTRSMTDSHLEPSRFKNGVQQPYDHEQCHDEPDLNRRITP